MRKAEGREGYEEKIEREREGDTKDETKKIYLLKLVMHRK